VFAAALAAVMTLPITLIAARPAFAPRGA